MMRQSRKIRASFQRDTFYFYLEGIRGRASLYKFQINMDPYDRTDEPIYKGEHPAWKGIFNLWLQVALFPIAMRGVCWGKAMI